MGFLGTPLGYIMYWLFQFINNYGLTLILFVILTKIALFPLAVKQQKSMGKTMAFQPKLKALEKKCGANKQKYQEEMMKLYEEEGISPMGGCLPTIIQMVLLFGIVDVIYNPLKHLLHIDSGMIKAATDVIGKAANQLTVIQQVQTNPEKFATIFGDQLPKITEFNMNFLGMDLGALPNKVWGVLIIVPIVSFLTQIIMTIISMKQQKQMGQSMQGMMKGMMYIMPIFSLYIAFTLPAGVGVYWIVSNVFQIAQQLILYKIYTPEKLAKCTDKNAEKQREKMKKKRLKMEEYKKVMEARGIDTNDKAKKNLESADKMKDGAQQIIDDDSPEVLSQKEMAKKRLAEARKRQAEKYGEEYKDE